MWPSVEVLNELQVTSLLSNVEASNEPLDEPKVVLCIGKKEKQGQYCFVQKL